MACRQLNIHVSQKKSDTRSLCLCYLSVKEGQVSLSTPLSKLRVYINSSFYEFFDGHYKSVLSGDSEHVKQNWNFRPKGEGTTTEKPKHFGKFNFGKIISFCLNISACLENPAEPPVEKKLNSNERAWKMQKKMSNHRPQCAKWFSRYSISKSGI